MAEFKHGREILEDDSHSGRPGTVSAPEIVTKVIDMVMDDRRVTERYILIACVVGSFQERVHSIPTEDLEMRKASAPGSTRITRDSRFPRNVNIGPF